MPGRRNTQYIETPGTTIWFTGRSAAGKTTLAEKFIKELHRKGHRAVLIDGDIIRKFVKNPDFTREGRIRHLMYIALMTEELNKNSITTICTFVSPYEEVRKMLRETITHFKLVHIKCSLEEARNRDPKGLYNKIKPKGITIFEDPQKYDLEIDTEQIPSDVAVKILLNHFRKELP